MSLKNNFFQIFTLILIVFFSNQILGQNKFATLSGSGNDNFVKLLWQVNNWSTNLDGFNIKRKVGNSDWIKLNQTVISPEINANKDFSNVEKDTNEIARLQNKIQTLIASEQIIPASTEEYLAIITKDKKALLSIQGSFGYDYDYALMEGFGLIDRKLPKASSFTYGLFPVNNGKEANNPISTFRFSKSSKVDFGLEITARTSKTIEPKELQILWNYSRTKFKDLELAGFEIYRKKRGSEFKKISKNIIRDYSQVDVEVFFLDEEIEKNTIYTYGIAPVDFFGNEGKKTTVVFDPTLKPIEIKPPEIISIQQVYNPSVQVKIDWKFDKSLEKEIDGFHVQRAFLDSIYKLESISNLISPNERVFFDNHSKLEGQTYSYRVIAVKNDYTTFSGEKVLIYTDLQIPPTPTGLQGKWINKNGKNFIDLNWNTKSPSDKVTNGYSIYSSRPSSEEILKDASIPLIKINSYLYEVKNLKSAVWKFRIVGESKNGLESELSETIEVLVPTQKMPNISIWPFKVDSNRVTLNWDYKEIQDLKGFQIYQNDKLVADSNTLGKESRVWVSDSLRYGEIYNFQIEAISQFDVKSKKSKAVKLKAKKKK
ncbi:MAG: hypothetical protein DWQ06_09850 [Calditrichaeota bacterium]|nr:MAG: hypothetical protein DWQ06_09850 [Calditrichota bacterium]